MNKTKLSVLFTIGILLTVAVVASIDISQTAEAAKSKGVKTQKYGQATKDKVCGDRLCSEVSPSTTTKMDQNKMKSKDQMNQMHQQKTAPLYNEVINPSQIEYQNIVGFNDLHIEAIRHLDPNGDDSKLNVIVHHHCKVYEDMTATCLLFPTGMNDQDKPYGIEYVITSEQYEELPDEEKPYWHYHLTEFPRAMATFPDLTDEELVPLQPVLDETYGKVFYFWDIDDKYPIGEPSVLVIQDLPE